MEWKPFYRDELTSTAGRAAFVGALRDRPGAEPQLVEALRGGGVLSFPHTTVFASAVPIARAVAALYELRPRAVVALGVLHGAAAPEPFRARHAAFARWLESGAAPSPDVRQIFAELGGAFFLRGPQPTAFLAAAAAADPPEPPACAREGGDLLANEFSLDFFLNAMAVYAVTHGRAPLPVIPLYVLLTRDPEGGFAAAGALAEYVARLAQGGAAVVATGDLVHFGRAYSGEEEIAALPSTAEGLAAHFRPAVEAALARALRDRDYEGFYRDSLAALRNDQRNVLPVIAELLGPGASAILHSFELTDYSGIWGVPPPCVVASALVAYRPARRG